MSSPFPRIRYCSYLKKNTGTPTEVLKRPLKLNPPPTHKNIINNRLEERLFQILSTLSPFHKFRRALRSLKFSATLSGITGVKNDFLKISIRSCLVFSKSHKFHQKWSLGRTRKGESRNYYPNFISRRTIILAPREKSDASQMIIN